MKLITLTDLLQINIGSVEVWVLSTVRPRANHELVRLPLIVRMNLQLPTSTCVVSECTIQQRQATLVHLNHGLSTRP